ncbi:MAG: HNH endonuclease [Anaerolineae bacterium]|nr:HNH endonuclease [Anaerolineae bacterium]
MSRVPDSLRLQVRQRAGGRCEYCRKPEGVSAYPHQADHIVAVKHHGVTELDNLAWACFQCNTNKGSDLTTFDPDTGVLVRLFNPRLQQWDDHFEFADAALVGKSPEGRATIRLLQMNHPDQVETRHRLMLAGLWQT